MNKFLKCGYLTFVLVASLFSAGANANNAVVNTSVNESAEDKSTDDKNQSAVTDTENRGDTEEIVAAPNYTRVVPIKNWSRLSGDSACTLGEWKRWWSYMRMKKPVIMNWVNGLKLRIYPKNEVFRSIYVAGIYDPNIAVVINSLLPQRGVFIDVGANMGYLSLLASKVVGELGKVYAIEPSSRDFLRLVDNVNLNGLGNVYSYHIAILDSHKKAEINIAGEERSALNTFGKEFSYKGTEKLGAEEVQAVTIDEFVDTEKIGKVDLIKLDIEGSELSALRGARDSIEKFRPAIILGVNRDALTANGVDIADLKKMLQELRYNTYILTETPCFAFKEVSNLAAVQNKVVICMHESIIPPVLPQFTEKNWMEAVSEFFTR